MSSQPTLVIVPGWRNSGPGHWQSLWSERLGHAVRVEMAEDDWQRPKRHLWVQAIASVFRAQPGPVVVASTNDPFCPIRTAGAYARSWGSEVVRLQNAGHINVESGHGEWPLGLALLQSLMAEHSWSAQPQTELESV